jgi:hypothetical protein
MAGVLALLAILACHPAGTSHGVYKSGANAVARGARTGKVLVWGLDGTHERVPSEGPGGSSLLGESGPLWIVDHEVSAPVKPFPVDAAMVERTGFRIQPILGTKSTGAADAAKAGGVYVRSLIKVRRDHAPPLYIASATGDDVGAGKIGGPPDVRSGNNCRGILALLDAKGENLLDSVMLSDATDLCAVPVLAPPIDLDGDNRLDVLVYGQNENKGFRAWFSIDGEKLAAGPAESWDAIP